MNAVNEIGGNLMGVRLFLLIIGKHLRLDTETMKIRIASSGCEAFSLEKCKLIVIRE